MSATVNNVVIGNVPKGAGTDDVWPHYFAQIRALMRAGWKCLASSDGTTKTVSDDPELCELGAGTAKGVSGAAAVIAAPVNGRALVTGLAGISIAATSAVGGTGDKGNYLRITSGVAANQHYHQIEEIVDANSVWIDARRAAFTPVADAGPVSWEIIDPTEGGAPTDPIGSATIAWWLGAGPSTIKIPITAAPVAGANAITDNDQLFIPGEEVTQATTGATGEFLGYVFDGANGYLCIHPHARGSGGDPFGWATTNVITGNASGTTATQVGTAVEYRQQLVIHKAANRDNGIIHVQCIDPVGETAEDFAVLAADAACTNLIPPAGVVGPSGGNDFPADPFAACLLGSTPGVVADVWVGTNLGTYGLGQAVAIDAIPEPGYTADGEWFCMSPNAAGVVGHGMFRVLDGEPGAQLCPYVWACSSTSATHSFGNPAARRFRATGTNTVADQFNAEYQQITLNTSVEGMFFGYRARGSGLASDQYTTLGVWEPVEYNDGTNACWRADPGTPWLVGSDPNSPQPKLSGPVHFGSVAQASGRTWGGRAKRLRHVIDGGLLDTHDAGSKVQLSSSPGPFIYTYWDPAIVPVLS